MTLVILLCTADGKHESHYYLIIIIEHSLMCPSHFPHRHYTHSQQPVHCTKPCGGHGQPDGLPQYIIQYAEED